MDSRSRALLGVVVLAVLASLGIVSFRTLIRHDFPVIEPEPIEETIAVPENTETSSIEAVVEPTTQ